MNQRIIARIASSTLTLAAAVAAVAPGATAATTSQVAYDNFNTVPKTVNGHRDESTLSAPSMFLPFGGVVEVAATSNRVIGTLATQVDNFVCEHGDRLTDTCLTANPKTKAMAYGLEARIYGAGPQGEPVGSPVATSTETFKLTYRPSTNPSCPATSQLPGHPNKGFGVNCDIGGVLETVTFRHFTPSVAMPAKAVVEITNAPTDPPATTVIIGVGTQTAYKGWSPEPLLEGGTFLTEPPRNGGVPAIGHDPNPTEAISEGILVGEYTGLQPVFKVNLVS